MNLRSVAIALALSTLPVIGHAQLLPVDVAIEGRVGYLMPVGDFADASEGIVADPGIALAAGAAIYLTDMIGIFGGYHRANYGCEQCAEALLDDEIVQEGGEAGIHLALPVSGMPIAPWIRGGVLYQNVSLSGFDDTVTSDNATGFIGAVGLSVMVGEFIEVLPALRYFSLPADYEFDIVPDQSIDVTAVTIDLGLALRF